MSPDQARCGTLEAKREALQASVAQAQRAQQEQAATSQDEGAAQPDATADAVLAKACTADLLLLQGVPGHTCDLASPCYPHMQACKLPRSCRCAPQKSSA